MSPLRRAVRYPLRYKRYLIVVMLCVLIGGLCYGGGIGTIFPVIKLVISPEGPVGAADIRLSEEMLGVHLLSRIKSIKNLNRVMIISFVLKKQEN